VETWFEMVETEVKFDLLLERKKEWDFVETCFEVIEI
jgi:hypothetical protein